mmetsp:Transcript_15383/g.35222  ORF Transcript_15383/g.35222 Transcript_15383/m.35222 type:complete len:315 (-) Transcript_15383:314-1258(-)
MPSRTLLLWSLAALGSSTTQAFTTATIPMQNSRMVRPAVLHLTPGQASDLVQASKVVYRSNEEQDEAPNDLETEELLYEFAANTASSSCPKEEHEQQQQQQQHNDVNHNNAPTSSTSCCLFLFFHYDIHDDDDEFAPTSANSNSSSSVTIHIHSSPSPQARGISRGNSSNYGCCCSSPQETKVPGPQQLCHATNHNNTKTIQTTPSSLLFPGFNGPSCHRIVPLSPTRTRRWHSQPTLVHAPRIDSNKTRSETRCQDCHCGPRWSPGTARSGHFRGHVVGLDEPRRGRSTAAPNRLLGRFATRIGTLDLSISLV